MKGDSIESRLPRRQWAGRRCSFCGKIVYDIKRRRRNFLGDEMVSCGKCFRDSEDHLRGWHHGGV